MSKTRVWGQSSNDAILVGTFLVQLELNDIHSIPVLIEKPIG